MAGMFAYAIVFNQPLDNWNVSSVTDMHAMFYFASAFNQNLCPWFFTTTLVPDTTDMFTDSGCSDDSNPNFTTKDQICGYTC